MRRFQHSAPRPPHLFLAFHRVGLLFLSHAWLLMLLWSSTSPGVAAQECDLQCPTDIGAACTFGDSPHTVQGSSNSQEVSIRGMHCSCPPGYTGLRCEAAFESCGDGRHVCYHGGRCNSGEVDDFGNVQLYCDCSTARDGGVPHVGKYCQHATVAAEAEDCDAANEAAFCFNGGVCNAQYPDFGDGPCLCSNGHTGPRCEYTNGDDHTVVEAPPQDGDTTTTSTCSLNCLNGGTCTTGQQDMTNEFRFWENPSTTEYCSCPDTWDGPHCEIPRVPCGDNHYCFFGSTCEMDVVDGQTLHHCDCRAAATDAVSYAGRFCQYSSTKFCTDEPGPDGHLFCVNQGGCQSDPSMGCVCPTGYSGFSCEFRTEEETDLVGDVETGDGLGILLDTAEQAECSLDCQNGGSCRHGIHQGLDAFSSGESYEPFQYCVCASNFAGTYCEIPVDDEAMDSMNSGGTGCPAGQIKCANGACVGDALLCECEGSNQGQLATFFAGTNCEHPINDICLIDEPSDGAGSVTLGHIMPGAPLYFCLNDGVCKDKVDPEKNEGHPGCHCKEGWLGPHCELKEAAPIPNLPKNNPYENFSHSSSSNGTFEKIVLSFAILAIFIVAAFSARVYIRRKHKRNNSITSSLSWQPQYRDRPADEQVNIAPKRSSLHTDVYEQAVRSSTRDHMAAHLAAAAAAKAAASASSSPRDSDDELEDNDVSDHEPQVDMGPPLDDDGHELHNVSIV